jgi:dihydrofolate synthase/folylpolyglutamate synthase
MKSLSYEDVVSLLYRYAERDPFPQKPPQQDPLRLDRTRALMALLDNPYDQYPTLHVTGTKGKGSVSAMCTAILKANGLRVGMLTSPHLQDLRERFQINGVMVTEEQLTQTIREMKPALDKLNDLRWPEVITSVGFYLFAREKVDIAVIEVAYGGRLDATNIITPLVSIMTSISYDHMHLLGNTLGQIAWEKAGIIKPKTPVVSAPQPDEARLVIEGVAAECSAPLTLVGRDWQYTAHLPASTGQSITVYRSDRAPQTYTTALIGQHQAVNTAVTLAALERIGAAGIPVSEPSIREGLQNVNWPGRMEVVRRQPVVLLDCAHNGESARCLRESIAAIFSQRPRVLVYGSKANKDVGRILKELAPIVDRLVLTRSDYPITMDPEALVIFARESGYTGEVSVIPEVEQAIPVACELAGSEGLVCITGSVFLVGEARTLLGLAPNQAVPPQQP